MTGRLSLLAVVLATGAVQCFPAMPDGVAWVALFFGVALLSLATLALPGPGRFLIPLWAAAFGLASTVVRVEHRLADALAAGNENRVSRVELRVAGLVRLEPDSRQFEAEVIASRPPGVPSRILVSWTAPDWRGPYGAADKPPASFPALVPGQVWRMSLTLKRPHGARNPHGFDYEAHLFAQGLRATGSVRGSPLYLRDEPWHSLPVVAQRARHHVREAMRPYLRGKRYGAVLLALAIGDQASVDAADWQVFNLTGITHLVSISGSHITMIAAIGALLVMWAWRRLRFRGRALAERMPAQVAAAIAALAIAWLYCLLAGWGVPARRTFLMLAVVAAAHGLRLPLSASRLLCLALFAVVALDPWAILASGFWLSFGAVCILMASAGWHAAGSGARRPAGRRRAGAFLAAASRLQLSITAGLMPLLALVFHQVSVASPLANAYAIPVISLAVTPLSLLLAASALVPGLGGLAVGCAWLGHALLQAIMVPTVWLSELGVASFDVAHAPAWLTVLALAGLAVAILPYGFPVRNAAWLFMLPALFWRPERPPEGAWDAYILDVGQAGAVVIQTARHAVLFDTGLRGSATSDAGARTIWPFMRAQGIRKLDVMIVSHADIDHAGGARSLLASVPVEQSFSSFDLLGYLRREAGLLGMPGRLPPLPRAMSPCEQGMGWTVDGVDFEFVWPPSTPGSGRSARRTRPNDHACVLRVEGRHHSILLASDIGAVQEAALLERGLPATDVVLAAHHGSRNSSSPAFIRAMRAEHVVAQAGKWNRYGHPSPLVQKRWEQSGARFWRTDAQGAVHVRSRADGLAADGARQTWRRYWQGR